MTIDVEAVRIASWLDIDLDHDVLTPGNGRDLRGGKLVVPERQLVNITFKLSIRASFCLIVTDQEFAVSFEAVVGCNSRYRGPREFSVNI